VGLRALAYAKARNKLGLSVDRHKGPLVATVSALAANETSANEAAKPSAIPFSMIEAPAFHL